MECAGRNELALPAKRLSVHSLSWIHAVKKRAVNGRQGDEDLQDERDFARSGSGESCQSVCFLFFRLPEEDVVALRGFGVASAVTVASGPAGVFSAIVSDGALSRNPGIRP